MVRTTQLLWGLWRTLGSTRLAAALIAALLLASLLASLLPQMPSEPAAREPWLSAVALRYRGATGVLHALGLFDAYHTPWYLALLAALLINTLACTIQRLPRLWRALTGPAIVSRPRTFHQGFAQRSEWPVASLQAGLATAHSTLVQRRYSPRVERDETEAWASVYAERGRWSQAGTLMSHFSAILLVIAVAARPALGWQDTGLSLLPGQVRSIDQRPHLSVRAGSLTVDHHPGGEPRDYEVPLALLIGGSPAVTQTVRINQPLTFRGVAFHFQGYGPASQLATPEGTFHVAFRDGQAQEVFLPQAGLTLHLTYQPEERSLFVEALSADGTILGSGSVNDGQQIEVQGMPITFTLSQYTSWQVSHDPTFTLAVIAAGLMLSGMVLSLWWPHRRLWLRIDEHGAQMVGLGDFAGDFDSLASDMASAPAVSEGDADA